MKVGLLTSGFPRFEGDHSGGFLLTLARGLVAHGHEVRVLAIVTEGDTEIAEMADHVIEVPASVAAIAPLLNVIPLQLLAYHIAVIRGCDVDQPRNLAKSVTVE